jgi:hypothetical protein
MHKGGAMMKTCTIPRKYEEGSVLVIALLMLALLTVVGIAATTTSRIELQISGNNRFHKQALYHADSGVYTAPKLVSACIDDAAEQAITSGGYTPDDGTFYRETMGYDSHDAAPDVRFVISGFNVDVDVNRLGQVSVPGSSTEFASGAEGVGSGSISGIGVLYEMDSVGRGPAFANSNVVGVYRKVIGVAGGL